MGWSGADKLLHRNILHIMPKFSGGAAGFRVRRAVPAVVALLLAACADAVAPVAGDIQCSADAVVAEGRRISVAPNGYATVGNQIIQVESCEPHRFVGISRPPLAYAASDARMKGETMAADFAGIRSWKANTVRIEISQNFWVPTARWYDPAYPGRVDQAVKAARAAGLDVILALQTSDRGDPAYPGNIFTSNPQQQMPDANHTVPFWKDVATRYKDDGRIIFELFSEPYMEPHGYSDWDLWLNGGTVAAGKIYGENRRAFQAVGMKRLYDVVRGTGANNLVILSGTHWGYFLDGVPKHRVNGHNIAYSTHLWDWSDKQPATWDKDWAFLAQTDPVMITEFGNYDCTTGYVQKVLDKADQLNLSWVVWAWAVTDPGDTPAQPGTDPTCKSTSLLQDWSGTPTWVGRAVKDRLASY